MGSEQMTGPCVTGMTESGEWLTAEQFAGMEGMPGTAKGARLRLEKLTALHPEIRRKRTSGKGFLYHISAAGMALKSERDAADTSADEQLNLWIQLFRTMKPASRDKLLQQALAQVARDLTKEDVNQ
ncbi:TPA: hypothetical protein O3G77_002331 [Salmonella enterica subsp. enterica serovar Saintpaul str. CFSAN004155]|uniref:hypothetical protein n=1 Tax=Citrobacter portucalensis TaxID=1639133 RepID=UPI0012752D50|nr:hypothetical protein [Salmonella enterica]EBV7602499.1 hypothetical protein [Salmonella enterica subsp. enterica serovar Saintpaul]ECM5085942.1 hypothetical protein [Salmonella enterica subsp. enterica serovar Newport]ECT8277909.1 hypothetical protein [Salmonella enterica subsp. enterica]MDD8587992.1 hypothetical protein [Escherichia coli]HCZ4653351.1 hypothetical protein [Salmonella enterica subsp. enterica serovar Saintpaul str. CFSAN004157]HCZ4662435.1 hypothetical protein [Salmonella e